MMLRDYPWYRAVPGESTLEQGDFLQNCPVVVPPAKYEAGEETTVDIAEYNVIVMSQSCDIAQGKVDLILVCPVWSLVDFGGSNEIFKGNSGKEKLRRGEVVGYYLLNRCEEEDFEADFQVADFRATYSVDANFLQEFAREQPWRLRLLPPYREHLSQAFARFFMRVGLPVDIPPFGK